jgi:hypothetical protein
LVTGLTGARRALNPLRPLIALDALRSSRANDPLVALVALDALRTGRPLNAGNTLDTLRAGHRAVRTLIALRAGRALITLISLRARNGAVRSGRASIATRTSFDDRQQLGDLLDDLELVRRGLDHGQRVSHA